MIKEKIVRRLSDDISVYDYIVVGDEGCFYAAFNNNIFEIVNMALLKNKKIRYITPILSTKQLNVMRKYLIDLSDQMQIKVVFNDTGLLYSLKNQIRDNKIIPVFGRILTKSIIDCPWHENIVFDENDDIKVALTGNTFCHFEKMKLLRTYNIKEIEVNLNHVHFIRELKCYKYLICARYDSFLISVGRCCYTAYWHNLSINNCDIEPQCDNKIYIKLDKKWSKKAKMFDYPNEEDKKYFDHIFVQGTKVMSDTIYNSNQYENIVDFLIY